MSDNTGAAPAAAEQSPAPETQVEVPRPIESAGPQSEPEPKAEAKPEKPASIRDALDKADAKLKAEPKEPAKKAEPKAEPEAKAAAKDAKAEPVESKGPDRGEDGKFVSKEPKPEAKTEANSEPVKDAPWRETPKRFSDDAKREWESAPDSVKAETHRAIRELEDGLKEYQKRWEPLKDYDAKAKEYNTSIKDALDRYTGLETKLMSPDPRDKMTALQQVFDYAGINMREFVARMAGQQPDQTAVHYEGQLQTLRNENAELRAQLQGYKAKEEEATLNTVEQFAQDAAHPRFDELSTKIAKLLQSGLAENLDEAYKMADRLIPAAVQAESEPPRAETAPQPRAQKSIAGSPTPGSSPTQRKPSNSIMEALKRAEARASV